MAPFVRMLLAAIVLTFAPLGTCRGAESVRAAVQKSGTFAWELAVIRAHGLDRQANLSVRILEPLASLDGTIMRRTDDRTVRDV